MPAPSCLCKGSLTRIRQIDDQEGNHIECIGKRPRLPAAGRCVLSAKKFRRAQVPRMARLSRVDDGAGFERNVVAVGLASALGDGDQSL